MTSLLYKEFLTSRILILVYLAASLFYLTQFVEANGLIFITFFAMFFTFNAAYQEDKNNSHILLNSLPVSRKEVVTAKYLFSILFGLFLVGISLIYQAAFGPSWPDNILLHVGISIAAIIWFASVYYPLYFWLGPRFVQIGMIVFFILTFAVLPIIFNLGKKHNFWGIPELLQSSPVYLPAALLAGLTGIILLISWSLSVRLYERKDF